MEFRKFNSRFSVELYDWLSAESERTGVTMTAYVIMALETYRRQNEAMVTVEELYRQINAAAASAEKEKGGTD